MTRKSPHELRIIPLGGLGEIGLNMLVLEQGDDLVIIDCGLMFPGDSLPGVDYVIPDFSYVLERSERVRGVVLTHGHEDHTGALPFLLQQLDVPVYSTPLTLGLVRERLIEHGLDKSAWLETARAGDTLSLASFDFEFIRVSHSIADSVALAIKTDIGVIIHTGDFKLDPVPVDGERADLHAFARYGEQGVTALLSDSTNVERGGYTLSESEVGKALTEVMQEASGRVIVAMFASNIHRIQQVFDSASRLDRKVALFGRSMEANTRIATKLGYLDIPEGVMVEPSVIAGLEDRKVVLLTTGTQGEPLSGLSRMARGEHKQVKIQPGDTVVLSSRFIPGNERAIDFLINEFYRRGAEVIYEKVSDIHVSGHASREELKLMIQLTRPQYFIPVHGEYRHLVKHSQLAMRMGIPRERVLVAEDGDIIIFDDIGGERKGVIETGRQVVDGTCVADSDDAVLQERRKLAKEGVLIAVARMNRGNGKLAGPIELKSIGFVFEEEAESVLEDARLFAEQELAALPARKERTREELAAELRAALKRRIKKSLFRFPVIIPLVVE